MSTRQPPLRSGRSAAPPDDSLISQIKSRLPIDDEIGRYVSLKPAPDGELKGKCCFHEDGEPSMYVNPGAGTYFCHGCGASGNVVTFISAMEGGDYNTTKFEIAERLGLIRPKELSGPQRLLASTFTKYQSALQSAKNAKAYLANRGISQETAKTFGMGFCWGNEFSNAPPEIIEEAKKAGLYSERSGRSYLGGRITFVIRDARGNVVAFAGRVLDRPAPSQATQPGQDGRGGGGEPAASAASNENKEKRSPPPKYLNTAETPIFKKSEMLYGMHESRPGIIKDGYATVVEGYFDVITLHQHGAKNALAQMGASSTEQAFAGAWAITDKIVFCLDGDKAGQEGTLRSIYAAAGSMKDGQIITVAHLPAGMDPDEYIVANGKPGWDQFISLAQPLTAYLSSRAQSQFNMATIEGRAGYLAHQDQVAQLFKNAPNIREEIARDARAMCDAIAIKQSLASLKKGMSPEEVDAELLGSIIERLQACLAMTSDRGQAAMAAGVQSTQEQGPAQQHPKVVEPNLQQPPLPALPGNQVPAERAQVGAMRRFQSRQG